MSEAEKKKRRDYRKNRDKWIFGQAFLIIVLTLAVLISSIVAVNFNKTYYVDYVEGGSIDYNVFLKENEFYDKAYLEKDQAYVASLIDHIIADFNYGIDMAAENVNYRYSYTVKSRLEIVDTTSEVAIFKPEQVLVEKANKTHNSSSKLAINEIIVLDYDEYNELAARFIETYSLTNTRSNIVVTLEVDVLSECDAMSGSGVQNYVSELRIPLTTKTVNIEMTSTVPNSGAKMLACSRGVAGEVFKTVAIVLGVVDVLLILLFVAFIYLTRTEDITYTARVKKILSQYKSYIQKINNAFDRSGYQLIFVDTFDEMLEIRDTIQAPILMYENEDKTCAKFFIPTDSKLLYMYEIKIEGYSEPEPEPRAETEATTIVKPNITNVVRPVVKVVVNTPAPAAKDEEEPEEEAEFETVLEEPEVEVEADEEVVVIAETVEEEPEVEPEDENGVDAIDVFWKERNNDGKTYRYDPDGNDVDEGDTVLVPTRDVANDREVVREAEVARGNYKIDPEKLDHPLKKIIAVVKRKAEKAFTSMITPEENNSAEE